MLFILALACVPEPTPPWSQPTSPTLDDTAGDSAADSAGEETDTAVDSGTETAADTETSGDSDSGGETDSEDSGYPDFDDEFPDEDGDGWSALEDCDETNPDVHPRAEDPEGDGIDGDCDGYDGDTWLGCGPVHVPDIWPTVADALASGNREPCLGEGTFTLPDGPDIDFLFGAVGQGRDRTLLVLEDSGTYLAYVQQLTVTGAAHTDAGFRPVDAALSDFTVYLVPYTMLLHLERTTVEHSTIAGGGYSELGVWIQDSYIVDSRIEFTMYGCWDEDRDPSCGGAGDFRIEVYNSTFEDCDYAFNVRADGDGYMTFRNNVFLRVDRFAYWDLAVLMGVEEAANIAWELGTAPDLERDRVTLTELDPQFEEGTVPPRPSETSPLVDAAIEGTETDYWRQPRTVPDIGAVER